jgi:hypothetical protein
MTGLRSKNSQLTSYLAQEFQTHLSHNSASAHLNHIGLGKETDTTKKIKNKK